MEKSKWYRCECGYEAASPCADDGWMGCPRCSGALYEKFLDVSDEVIKVWRVTLFSCDKAQSNYIDNDLASITESILGEMTPDSGDSFRIECLKMTQGEYHNLPEFAGF